MDKWIVGKPGGPAGPFWSIVASSGQVIAMQILSEENAREIANAHNDQVAHYAAGIPTNLVASANDAATWLDFFADKAEEDRGCRITTENLDKLHLAIKLLRKFLPKGEPEFTG